MEVVSVFASVILLSAPVVLSRPVLDAKLVDLTYILDGTTIGWITERPFEMTVTQNGTTEQNVWLQEEEYATGSHVGTHVDAPCHSARGRWTLEDIPLAYFVAPAAVIDITRRADLDPNALLLVEDLREWEDLVGQNLNGTIVLMRSGWGSRWPDREAYLGNANNDINDLRFPGISPEAADWLVHNRKVYGVGVDTLSLDNGFNFGGRRPAHQILLGSNVYGLENVANVHKLPIYGAQLHVSPMRVGEGACGCPTRIMAILP